MSKNKPTAWDITTEHYGYRTRWNLSKDGSVWIMKPGTVEEMGCIHTPRAWSSGRDLRNIYRTLMSRGTKACYMFACDPELNE